MKRTTLNVDPVEARDLLERVPRACLAFTCDEYPCSEPVTVLVEDDRYLVGIPSRAARRPTVGDEVVLLIDAGLYYFDLRAIYIRGHVAPVDIAVDAPGETLWFAVQPTRTVAWDYARIRRVDDES